MTLNTDFSELAKAISNVSNASEELLISFFKPKLTVSSPADLSELIRYTLTYIETCIDNQFSDNAVKIACILFGAVAAKNFTPIQVINLLQKFNKKQLKSVFSDSETWRLFECLCQGPAFLPDQLITVFGAPGVLLNKKVAPKTWNLNKEIKDKYPFIDPLTSLAFYCQFAAPDSFNDLTVACLKISTNKMNESPSPVDVIVDVLIQMTASSNRWARDLCCYIFRGLSLHMTLKSIELLIDAISDYVDGEMESECEIEPQEAENGLEPMQSDQSELDDEQMLKMDETLGLIFKEQVAKADSTRNEFPLRICNMIKMFLQRNKTVSVPVAQKLFALHSRLPKEVAGRLWRAISNLKRVDKTQESKAINNADMDATLVEMLNQYLAIPKASKDTKTKAAAAFVTLFAGTDFDCCPETKLKLLESPRRFSMIFSSIAARIENAREKLLEIIIPIVSGSNIVALTQTLMVLASYSRKNTNLATILKAGMPKIAKNMYRIAARDQSVSKALLHIIGLTLSAKILDRAEWARILGEKLENGKDRVSQKLRRVLKIVEK